MAQFYEAKEVSEKIERQFEIMKWEKCENGKYFVVELPVAIYFNFQRLTLYIYPVDDGYYISDDGKTFVEKNNSAKYYYDLFNKKDKNFHYNIELKNDYLCKKYRFDVSLIASIDEFVRFFVFLDEFIQNNNIV